MEELVSSLEDGSNHFQYVLSGNLAFGKQTSEKMVETQFQKIPEEISYLDCCQMQTHHEIEMAQILDNLYWALHRENVLF